MTEKPQSSVTTCRIATLRELISALDRRVPHAERPGEIGIARDAHKLRHEAVARIDSLRRVRLDDSLFNQELAEAIMTDDGGPHESETIAPIVMRRSEVGPKERHTATGHDAFRHP